MTSVPAEHADKPIVEDFVPYRRSMLWKIHDLYYTRRGVAAFHEGDIPWRATNNPGLARQYAELIIALAGTRPAGTGLTVVEIGSGSGQFAANVMSALELDLGDVGRSLYSRVRYVMSDFQATSVLGAAASDAAKAHVARGRILPAIYDLRRGDRPRLVSGGELGTPALVIANYIGCVSPTTYLRRTADGPAELNVRVYGTGRNEDVPPSTVSRAADDLVAAYAASTTLSLRGCEREYEWRTAELGTPFDDAFHARVLARLFGDTGGTVTYPYGFLDALRGLESWLPPEAVVVLSDYGSPGRTVQATTYEPRPVQYGDSLNHAVNFVVLDAFAAELGWDVVRTDDSLQSILQVMLSRTRFPDAVRRAFAELFARRHDGSDLMDDIAAAQLFSKQQEPGRAARFYGRAIDREPRSAELHYQMAETCIAANEHARAIKLLQRCLELDPTNPFDTEFVLGSAYYGVGNNRQALVHYERSLRREDHPVTWFNIALARRALGDLKGCCQALGCSIALDPNYQSAQRMIDELRNTWWNEQIAE